MAGLLAYIEQEAVTPFVWGRSDCLMFVAGWIQERCALDLAAPWRGKYATERQCLRILKSQGGLVGLMQRQAVICGFGETDAPADGDVGALMLPTLFLGGSIVNVPTGAIRVNGRWAIKSKNGLTVLEAAPLAAWSI